MINYKKYLKNMNIRLSTEYASYLKKLGWFHDEVKTKTLSYFIVGKKFPLIGSYLRLVIPTKSFPLEEVEYLIRKNRGFKIIIAATDHQVGQEEKLPEKILTSGYRYTDNTLLPTKTILIDLNSLDKVWQGFTPAKQRAIRAAQKRGLKVFLAKDESEFLKLKQSQLRPFGFLLNKEIKSLWHTFRSRQKADILLASDGSGKVLAGVFLLFHDKIAYYWMASATKEGKTNYAPSLLVWEALRLAKKRECKVFDFEGIEDERIKETKSWRGFTIFKKGFGGKIIYRFRPIQKIFWPTL